MTHQVIKLFFLNASGIQRLISKIQEHNLLKNKSPKFPVLSISVEAKGAYHYHKPWNECEAADIHNKKLYVRMYK